jgi:hypothetical protein
LPLYLSAASRLSKTGSSQRLGQTAIEGQSRHALRPSPTAARDVSWRPRNSRVPRDGPSKRRARAPQSGPRWLPARREGSLRTESLASDLQVRQEGRAAPGAHPKQRGRERGRTGASRARRPQRSVSCSTLAGARPWQASVRPLAPRHGRQGSLRIRASCFSAWCRRAGPLGPPPPGHVAPRASLPIEHGGVQRLTRDGHPQVQGVAAGTAAKAMPGVLAQVRREAATRGHWRAMHRARPP